MSSKNTGDGVIVGYEFYLGAQMVACHGPVDAVTKIIVDTDKVAWSGTAADQVITINKENLFGGQEREGGIVGKVNVQMGKPTQSPDTYLQNRFGAGNTPAYRGVVQLVLRHVLVGMNNHYLKPWKIRAVRLHVKDRNESQWQDAYVEPQAGQMNPAHIIRECLTSVTWGLGYPESFVDETSFLAAAQTLYNEQFGLSFLWNNSTEVGEFIRTIEDHIDGSVYQSRTTGKFELKLVRNDYTVGNLLLLNTSNVVEVSSFKKSLLGELTSSLTIKFWDATTGKDGSVTVKDVMLEQQQGATVHKDITLEGITSKGLAQRVAHHKLLQYSTPLYMCQIVCNRDAENLYEGYAFRLYWPDFHPDTLVMRVTDIDLGTVTSNTIKITAIQDIFSAVVTTYDDPYDSDWEDPINEPSTASSRIVQEVPYYVVASVLGDRQAQAVDPSSGYTMATAVRPTQDAYACRIMVDYGDGYVKKSKFNFAPACKNFTALTREIQSEFTVYDVSQGLKIIPGMFGQIGSEIFTVAGIVSTDADGIPTELLINRGIFDTTPQNHNIGTAMVFWDGYFGTDRKEYVISESINYKLLTITPKGTLDQASAPVNNVIIQGRMHRPYAPGQFKVNGNYIPTTVTGPVTVTWAHRHRTAQTAYPVLQTEGSVGPEPGTTYTCEWYDGATLKDTKTGITGTTTVNTVLFTSSNARVELWAVNGGNTSYHRQISVNFTII